MWFRGNSGVAGSNQNLLLKREAALVYSNDAEAVRHRGAQLGTICPCELASDANATAAERLRRLRQLSSTLQFIRLKRHDQSGCKLWRADHCDVNAMTRRYARIARTSFEIMGTALRCKNFVCGATMSLRSVNTSVASAANHLRCDECHARQALRGMEWLLQLTVLMTLIRSLQPAGPHFKDLFRFLSSPLIFF